MKLISAYIYIFFFLSLPVLGQTKRIVGKVVNENLEVATEIRIHSLDTLLLGITDSNGEFKIEVPDTTKTIIFSWVGYEKAAISLDSSCQQLDIILMSEWTYDYISLAEVDKLRLKRFKKLPKLHRKAFKESIFKTEKSCYTQTFIPSYKGA